MQNVVIPLQNDEDCKLLTKAQKALQQAVDANAKALRRLAVRMAKQRRAKTGLVRKPPRLGR
jgi:hypothetical protein